MASNSQIVAAFNQVPLLVKSRGPSYFDHMLEWRRMTELYLLEQCAHLVQIGYKRGLHFELLTTTLAECGNLVRNRELHEVDQLPTQEQLWDVLKNNRAYVYSPNRKAWYPESPHAAEYAGPGNLFPNITGQHSLLKPEIGRRVAGMYGTTKGRWERDARAF
ncbi:hypothetical protein JCM10296v2_005808 [Rhodotorula toruloides]